MPDLVNVAQVGLARVALEAGDLVQAQARIEPVLLHLAAGGQLDAEQALICYRILQATQDSRAEETLTTAYGQLQVEAAKIADDATRQMFLHNVPWHRELAATWAAQHEISAGESR